MDQVSSTGFEPMTSEMPEQYSDQLSFEATKMWEGQFVRFMCYRERNDEWKKCLWSEIEIWIEEMIISCAQAMEDYSGM